MSEPPRPPELAPSVLRDQLLKSCQHHYNEALANDKQDADQRRVRDGLIAARTAIESVDAEGALGSYVHRLIVALEHERATFLAFDADDPDHWRSGAVRTILRELEHTAGWLLPTPPAPTGDTILVPREILELLESQLPLVRELHQRGSLAPLAASMNAHGEIAGNALSAAGRTDVSVESTLHHFSRTFGRVFAAGPSIKAAGIFFHGHAEDRIVRAAHTVREANALVVWLQHESGQSVQAVVLYERDESAPDEWKYGSPTFSEVAAFPVD
jgi:hypothetical protein